MNFKGLENKQNMKKIVVAFVALLLSVAVCAQEKNNFEIKFDIKGVTTNKAYFSVIANGDAVNLSSEILEVKDGKVTLKGYVKQTVIARISFDQVQFLKKVNSISSLPSKAVFLWFVLQPGDNYVINGNLEGKDFIALYPTYNKENEFLAKLTSKWMPLVNEISNTKLSYYRYPELTTSQKDSLNSRVELLEKESSIVKNQFIEANPSSVAALWLVEDMFTRKEIKTEEVRQFLKRINKKYRSTLYYTNLDTKLKGESAIVVGKKCPKIVSDRTINGKTISLSDFKNKYVIVDFWGTWCGPCMAGMPSMRAFRDKHSDKLEILGIASEKGKDARERWISTINKSGLTWSHILSGGGDQDFVVKFNVTGFPTKILVSPDGTILYRGSGESQAFYDEVERLISK